MVTTRGKKIQLDLDSSEGELDGERDDEGPGGHHSLIVRSFFLTIGLFGQPNLLQNAKEPSSSSLPKAIRLPIQVPRQSKGRKRQIRIMTNSSPGGGAKVESYET